MLSINPGSPSLPRNLRKLGSVGILEVTPGKRAATIVALAGLDA